MDTRERLQHTATELFARQGYAQTTVADVARAAGVSHMTFFRHFPTKEAVVLDDPFDPLIADAVALRPRSETPFTRVVRGLLDALSSPQASAAFADPGFAARIGLVAATPELHAAVWRSTEQTRQAVAASLVASGVSAREATSAAGAALGAATALLLLPCEDLHGELVAGLSALAAREPK